MAYELVEQPVPCPEAFQVNSNQAIQSQAALLLLLGRQLRGDEKVLESLAEEVGRDEFVEVYHSGDANPFPVPQLASIAERSVDLYKIESRLRQRYQTKLRGQFAGQEDLLRHPMVLSDLAKRLYERPTVVAAAELMEASLHHPDELVRVAAASSYFHLSSQAKRLTEILEQGTRSEDVLVRDVAATSMSHTTPEHVRLREMTESPGRAFGAGLSHTAMLIHGTFARDDDWWKPGGDFHTYLLSDVRNDLYDGDDRYAWSGGYSDNARNTAGTDLVEWVLRHGFMGLDLFAHSHGCSVAMIANNSDTYIGTLVLLSCPVHIHKYMPDFTHVNSVVSLHVHMDLVILADRGGLRFRHPKIRERVLPIWFDHSATHYPHVWLKYDVPSLL